MIDGNRPGIKCRTSKLASEEMEASALSAGLGSRGVGFDGGSAELGAASRRLKQSSNPVSAKTHTAASQADSLRMLPSPIILFLKPHSWPNGASGASSGSNSRERNRRRTWVRREFLGGRRRTAGASAQRHAILRPFKAEVSIIANEYFCILRRGRSRWNRDRSRR